MLHIALPTILAVEEAAESGGLFDIDATMPLMAVQFVILALILNAVLYKPLGQAIDERADYIRNQQVGSQEQVAKIERMTQEYEDALSSARREAQDIVAEAQAEAQAVASKALTEAQQQAQAERETARGEIDKQKEVAIATLDAQVDTLSRQIVKKLLGYELS
ncbi:MAG: F0F1 ATP synthase subunit B' [Cyanophyceae cyanobacterium]